MSQQEKVSLSYRADRNDHSSARFKSNSSPIHAITRNGYLMCWPCNVTAPARHSCEKNGEGQMGEWCEIMKINTQCYFYQIKIISYLKLFSFLAQNGFNLCMGHNGYDCCELLAYLKVEQMNFDIQFSKQCCSVMHDWRNFNNASFESIMVILYDNSMTTVIHPQLGHSIPLFQGSVFFSGTLCIGVGDSIKLYFRVNHNNVYFKALFRKTCQQMQIDTQ